MSNLVTAPDCRVFGKITRSGFDTRRSRPPASTIVALAVAMPELYRPLTQPRLGPWLAAGSFHTAPREGRLGAVRILRITQEVVLVLGRVFPEATGLADLGHGLAEPVARGVDVADCLL